MSARESSRRDSAAEVIATLPESATANDILLAIHQRLNLVDSLGFAASLREPDNELPRQTARSKFVDTLGCLIPLLVVPLMFLTMPVLFSLGEKIIGRPTRTVEDGTIRSITLDDGSKPSSIIGKSCKVVSSHLIIESTDHSVTLIPNESYRRLELDKDPY